MLIGIALKGANAVHFRSGLNFFFEFVPQFILLIALFGYMDLIIFVKWLTNFWGKEGEAPSIITFMINMGLNGGAVTGQQLIPSQ